MRRSSKETDAWRLEERRKEARYTLQHLQDENQNHPDLADRAGLERRWEWRLSVEAHLESVAESPELAALREAA